MRASLRLTIDLAKKLEEHEAQRAAEAAADAAATAVPDSTLITDTTVAPSQANETMTTLAAATPVKDHSSELKLKPALKKRLGAPAKLTAKEKRARDMAIEAAVNVMPLEFRSADPVSTRYVHIKYNT
jgi:DASH complex subunit DAM1